MPIVKKTPVLAGVCVTDPFRVMEIFLKQLKEQGFNGVQNFPTVGLIDGKFRANLEETGMGYGLEVDMIREAHKLDMLTCPYRRRAVKPPALAVGMKRRKKILQPITPCPIIQKIFR